MYLHSRRFTPRPYQESAVQRVVSLYGRGERELLLHLPTGSGKTIIATLIIERLLPLLGEGKVLFVAHRKELLDQTADKLGKHLPELTVSFEQGERRASLDARLILASIQSLIARKDAYPAERFSLIIIDECHHALAPSWQAVIQYFHDRRARGSLLLGMTATPRRSDGRSAVSVFKKVAYEISRPELQDLGYLVPIQYWAIKASLSLDQVKLSGSDFQVGALSRVMNTPAVRALTLAAWEARGAGKKTIVFCASVPHAHQLAADFAALGQRTEVIEGRTKNRGELLRRYHWKDFDLLLNYGVLTEGFDEPGIDCVLLARPTTSPLVYNQCLGRGLRPAPGKTHCTVIDIVDRSTHQLQYGACQFAGLAAGWKTSGRDPFREARSVAGVRVTDPEIFIRLRQARSLEQLQEMLMQLPPESVLAGLDGEPVPRYSAVPDPLPAAQVREVALGLLERAGAPVDGITITPGPRADPAAATARGAGEASGGSPRPPDAAPPGVQIALSRPRENNERFGYLCWHIQRAVGLPVSLCPVPQRYRQKNPRALLRSLLPEDHPITRFEVDEPQGCIRAEVSGLEGELLGQVRRSFEAATGLTLDLQGQLSFGF